MYVDETEYGIAGIVEIEHLDENVIFKTDIQKHYFDQSETIILIIECEW